MVNHLREARKLANFIQDLNSFEFIETSPKLVYNHYGALTTDIVLQTGLNYNYVVKPRVDALIQKFPNATKASDFYNLINEHGLSNLIKWNHSKKIERILCFVLFSQNNNIETCDDLKIYLSDSRNHKSILSIDGFGPKTLDYTMKLLSFDTIAVDRHINSFLNDAGIITTGYLESKLIVEFAADFMNMSRRSLDYSIWKYKSNKSKSSKQISLLFG